MCAMGDGDSKKGRVTAEHKEEARRLRALWDKRKKELGLTQAQFGHDFNIGNQAAVGFFLNGQTALSAKAAAGFARGLGCSIGDFSPRLAKLLDEAPALPLQARPFPGLTPERFAALTLEQRLEIQGVVRERLESFERASQYRATTAVQEKRRLQGR